MMAVLDRQSDEALFWAYELFYSGLENEIIEFIKKLYDTVYAALNPKMHDFVHQLPVNQSKDLYLGSMVMTLCVRSYDLSSFIHDYFSRTSKLKEPIQIKPHSFRIHLQQKDIAIYQTQEIQPVWKTLRQQCRFPIRRNIYHLFHHELPEDYTPIYHSDNWLNYAAKIHLWQSRIEEHGGSIHQQGQVTFPTEEDKDSFEKRWAFEPDEQPKETQNCFIGVGTETRVGAETQLTIEQFAEKYGMVLDKPKKKIIKKKLENTLVLHEEPIKTYSATPFV
jgi:hypothetical protein